MVAMSCSTQVTMTSKPSNGTSSTTCLRASEGEEDERLGRRKTLEILKEIQKVWDVSAGVLVPERLRW